MKDFKSYSEGRGNGQDGEKDSAAFENDKGVEMVKKVAASMKGRSEGDILRAVIAEAERGKREGTLTNADLDNFYNLMAPTLDGFRRHKLKGIIDKLKKL